MSKICQNCNEVNIDEAKFCRSCGTELFKKEYTQSKKSDKNTNSNQKNESTTEKGTSSKQSLIKTYTIDEMSFEEAKKLLNDFYSKFGYKVITDDDNSYILKNEEVEDSYVSIIKQNVSKKIQIEIKNVSKIIKLKDSKIFKDNVENQYDSIGGWLILVAIGLIISHLYLIVDFMSFNSSEVKDSIAYSYIISDFDWFNKFTLVLWLDVVALFLLTLTSLHFFTKSKTTKILLIVSYSSFIILGLISMGVLDSMGIKESSTEITKTFTQMFVCLIWLIYFILSKRVKGTFVLEQSILAHCIKIILSLIIPIVLMSLYYNMISEQKYEGNKSKQIREKKKIEKEKKKKEILTLSFYRNLFESESEFSKILKKKKENIIDSEISTFKKSFSLKDKYLYGEKDILNYVNENYQYTNFAKGILYFCGKECSKLNQNFYSSHSYLNKSHKDLKSESSILLAEMNFYGIGTSHNIEKAVKLAANSTFKETSLKGTKYYYVGVGYLLGKYYKKDINKSIEYFKKSANLNNSSSAYLTALLMATEKNKYTEDEIVNYFNKSTKLGNPSSEMMLGLYYNENNKKVKAKNILANCYYSNKNCKYYYGLLFDDIPKKKKSFRKVDKKTYIQKKVTSKYSLKVSVNPKDAKVKILNIKPKYYDNIKLKKGKYHIKVSKNGYESIEKWINLDKNEYFTAELKKINKTKKSSKPSMSHLSSDERSTIENVCNYEKRINGPSAYYGCIKTQINSLY